jgi:hypothetical protein
MKRKQNAWGYPVGVDTYRPEQWHDFLIVVGGGSAALTGLVVSGSWLLLIGVTHDELPILKT